MANRTWNHLLSALPVASVVLVAASLGAGAALPAPAVDYMLDDASGKFALYAGTGYRCFILPKDTVSSLEGLERKVSQLPPGTKIYWMPYLRESSGAPILFSKGQ